MTDRARLQTLETTGSAGNTLRRTASAPGLEWTADGATTTVYKTADESVSSSTTLQNDDQLTLNVVAGARYIIGARLFLNIAGNSGVKVALNGTSTVTSLKIEVRIYDTGLAANGRATAYGSAVSHGASVAGSHYIDVDGAIEVNAAGTLVIQWAQSSSSADAVTMQIASSLRLTRVS